MLSANKKRTVVSYENMSPALSAAFSEKYPKGFNDYFQDLMKFEKPDGTSFYAVTVETEDTISLVKIKVRMTVEMILHLQIPAETIRKSCLTTI